MIENLNLKLNGELQVTQKDLFELVASWGRKIGVRTFGNIDIIECKPKECYDLSNLDVSKIKDFSYLFYASFYNGDLSKWNLSNAINCNSMFEYSNFNNDSICNWNISNVKKMNCMFERSKFNKSLNNWDISNATNMNYMFENSKFSGNISSWIFNNKVSCESMFCDNKNFIQRYNDGNNLPENTKEFLEWFENNKNNIKFLNDSKESVLDFFSFESNKEIENNY